MYSLPHTAIHPGLSHTFTHLFGQAEIADRRRGENQNGAEGAAREERARREGEGRKAGR